MVSILENLDNKGTREEVKRVNLHRTQELHKTEAIKETSVPIATEAIKKPSIPIANEMTSLQFLTETSTNTTQIQTGAVETLTTETLENCVVQDMPSGVQNFQPLSCSQDYNSEGNTGKDVIGSTFGSTNGPSFLKKVKPEYPRLARRLDREGKVVLKLFIDEHGGLVSVTIIEKAGYGFDEAAIEAVKASVFQPAKSNGILVACTALLPIKFKLE